MSLKEVFEKVNAQPDPSVGYVYDAPIHYVVLNNDDGSVNLDINNKLEKVYD